MDEQKTPIEQVLDFSEEEVYLAALVEALLFSLGGPVSRKELMAYCSTTAEKIDRAVAFLLAYAPGRGIVPVVSGDMVELRASAVASEIIEKARKESYNRDIGRAGMEVLAAALTCSVLVTPFVSSAVSAVISFVSDASGNCSSSFFAKSMRPSVRS